MKETVEINPEGLPRIWKFDDFRKGVLYLHSDGFELRVRFWPDPFLEVREGVKGAWQTAPFLGGG
jgi:hypothetical protein